MMLYPGDVTVIGGAIQATGATSYVSLLKS